MRVPTCNGFRIVASASCTMSGLLTNGSVGLSRLTNASREGRDRWTDRERTTFPAAVRDMPGPILCTPVRTRETASFGIRALQKILHLRAVSVASVPSTISLDPGTDAHADERSASRNVTREFRVEIGGPEALALARISTRATDPHRSRVQGTPVREIRPMLSLALVALIMMD